MSAYRMALCAAVISMNRSMQTQRSVHADGRADRNTSGADVILEFVPSMLYNNNTQYLVIILSPVWAHGTPDMSNLM